MSRRARAESPGESGPCSPAVASRPPAGTAQDGPKAAAEPAQPCAPPRRTPGPRRGAPPASYYTRRSWRSSHPHPARPREPYRGRSDSIKAARDRVGPCACSPSSCVGGERLRGRGGGREGGEGEGRGGGGPTRLARGGL